MRFNDQDDKKATKNNSKSTQKIAKPKKEKASVASAE